MRQRLGHYDPFFFIGTRRFDVGDPVRRNNFWFVVLFVLMIVGGLCVIGYWQTYDLRCGYGRAVWTWTVFPPKFQCPTI